MLLSARVSNTSRFLVREILEKVGTVCGPFAEPPPSEQYGRSLFSRNIWWMDCLFELSTEDCQLLSELPDLVVCFG